GAVRVLELPPPPQGGPDGRYQSLLVPTGKCLARCENTVHRGQGSLPVVHGGRRVAIAFHYRLGQERLPHVDRVHVAALERIDQVGGRGKIDRPDVVVGHAI